MRGGCKPETVQATKMVDQMTYRDRLRELGLFSLEKGRLKRHLFALLNRVWRRGSQILLRWAQRKAKSNSTCCNERISYWTQEKKLPSPDWLDRSSKETAVSDAEGFQHMARKGPEQPGLTLK